MKSRLHRPNETTQTAASFRLWRIINPPYEAYICSRFFVQPATIFQTSARHFVRDRLSSVEMNWPAALAAPTITRQHGVVQEHADTHIGAGRAVLFGGRFDFAHRRQMPREAWPE